MANILLITGNVAGATALALESLMEGDGHVVTVVDDGITFDTTGMNGIVVADDALDGAVAAQLLSSPLGLVAIGNGDWPSLNLCTAGSTGAAQTQIEVKNTAHPIAVAAGFDTLDEMLVITASTSDADRVNPGALAAGATRIADDQTTTDGRVVLFAVSAGGALTTGNAAGRRVGWGHHDPASWNALAQTIFLASVDWAAEGAAPATLSVGTPSGTIGTQTTATIGATTDQATGTFYAVVDSSANLTGVTATQIKAGQHAGGSAALASGDVAVSTTSPSVGVAGLVANTTYAYAAIQNNANGDSNIVTGTFTTAAVSPTSGTTPGPLSGRRIAILMMN